MKYRKDAERRRNSIINDDGSLVIVPLRDEGDKYFLRDEYDSAKNCYDRVIKINPNHADAWYKKGNVFYNLENLEEAIKCYNRVLLINPNHANAWYKKGIAYKKKNNHDKALECLDKAIQTKANSSNVWYEKGLSLSYLKRYNEAVKHYDNAIEIKPDHAEAWYRKGYALYNMGMKDEAQSCYNRAKEINSDFPGEWYERDNEHYSPSSSQPGPEPVTISPPSQALPRQPAAAPLAQRFKQRTTLLITGATAAAAIALLLVVSQGNMFLPNNVPIANAGIDKTVDAGSLVTLNGSSSSDPDNNDMITSYKWEQTTGSPLIELDNPDSPSPSFTSPIITSDTKFTFRLTVTDQNNQSANDDVEITVRPVSSIPLSPSQPNDVPVGDNIDATTDQDTPVKIALSASDADNDPLEFAIGSFPSHGSLTGFDTSTNTVTYTPNQDYTGKDSFTFKVADNKGSLSDPATVSITIIPAPNNIPTVPAEQSILTDQDTSMPITLTANDADNDTLNFSIVSHPSHGNLSGTAPNLVYTPQQNYVGADSFTYKVNDGKADSNIGNITINMRPQTVVSQQQETGTTTATTIPTDNEPITVKTDRPSYSRGDTITITGTVIEREPGEALWISIVDPNSNEVVATTIPVTGSNTFSLSFASNDQGLEALEGNIGNGQMNTSGVYLVTVDYNINDERVIVETTFTFTA